MKQDPQLISFRPPTRHEVKKQLKDLKEKAAPGSDGIPAKVWKVLCEKEEMFEVVFEVMKLCWKTETTPHDWSEKIHFLLLYKKGPPILPANWRPIMVEKPIAKVWQGLLAGRLDMVYEAVAPENANGFRRGRGTPDTLFTHKTFLRKRKEHGLDTWVLYLDVVKAFDRVVQEYLWQTLLRSGVPEKLVLILEKMYARRSIELTWEGASQRIDVTQGAGQGSRLGPKLFAFYMYKVLVL